MKKTDEEIKAYNDYKKYIRSAAFKKVRDKVFERDGYRCVCCGRTADETTLVCHHKCYRHVGEGNEAEISDCVSLCQNDHVLHHRGKHNYRWYSFSNPRNKKDLENTEQ